MIGQESDEVATRAGPREWMGRAVLTRTTNEEETTVTSTPRPADGPLVVSATNPRYFTPASGPGAGRAVYLTGSHIWNNLHDGMGPGPDAPPEPERMDYRAYLRFLAERGHNFIGCSTEALLSQALFEAVGEWGARLDEAMAGGRDPAAIWDSVIALVRSDRAMWTAEDELVGQRDHGAAGDEEQRLLGRLTFLSVMTVAIRRVIRTGLHTVSNMLYGGHC